MKEQIFTNPITTIVKQAIGETSHTLKIAVPFISTFAREIINKDLAKKIIEKKLITRFDDTYINSFDIPTLEYLIDNGFKIRYDNNIHLKLYITDNKSFITSSNLTKGGFEDNTELTVEIDSLNYKVCSKIFNELWNNAKSKEITKQLLGKNRDKYLLLKKRNKFKHDKRPTISKGLVKVGSLNIQLLIDEIFYTKQDYPKILNLSFKANKLRVKVKNELIKKKFRPTLFYAPKGHKNRQENLLYYLAHGAESNLAGTGLRDAQFKEVFEHKDFKEVISFIFPEMLELEPWNFDDEKIYSEFCKGLFDFNIPQYTEVIPIRLASYFYPERFLPIFKLDHLQEICNTLGLKTNAKSKGERLFAYNSYLKKKMSVIPFNNYIKSSMAYTILYSVKLFNRLQNGEKYNTIKNSYKKGWKRRYVEKGKKYLISINAINSNLSFHT
ncbi:MAG: phospholipase D family protein [Bacteroidetes bacterium]|nr:phospholipase D family protein [Bacteroidota bacterium]